MYFLDASNGCCLVQDFFEAQGTRGRLLDRFCRGPNRRTEIPPSTHLGHDLYPESMHLVSTGTPIRRVVPIRHVVRACVDRALSIAGEYACTLYVHTRVSYGIVYVLRAYLYSAISTRYIGKLGLSPIR